MARITALTLLALSSFAAATPLEHSPDRSPVALEARGGAPAVTVTQTKTKFVTSTSVDYATATKTIMVKETDTTSVTKTKTTTEWVTVAGTKTAKDTVTVTADPITVTQDPVTITQDPVTVTVSACSSAADPTMSVMKRSKIPSKRAVKFDTLYARSFE